METTTSPAENPKVIGVDVAWGGLELGFISSEKIPPLGFPPACEEVRSAPALRLEPLSSFLTIFGENVAPHLLLGHTTDPFHPFEGRFDLTLKILEILVRERLESVRIRTRSPLIVLALPLLVSLGRKAEVTLCLESLSDRSANKTAVPHLPRPSERIKAARALKRLGVFTSIQIAPVLPLSAGRRDAAGIAALLDDISCAVEIVPFEQIAANHLRTSSWKERFRQDSHLLVQEALLHRAPAKLALPSRNHRQDSAYLAA